LAEHLLNTTEFLQAHYRPGSGFLHYDAGGFLQDL